jgi:hypothetical protein
VSAKRSKTSPPPAAARDPFALDRTLLQLSANDAWTIADACEGTQIFGATGSGKTSGSGQAIAKAMLRAGFGGLVLTAKPDERELWERYCRETGRSDSLLVFGAATPHRFNFLDYELKRSGGVGLTENLVALFNTVLEAAERSPGGGGGSDPFWGRAQRQLLRNAIDALILSGSRVDLLGLARVIASGPQYPEQPAEIAWQAGSECFQCLARAELRLQGGKFTPMQARDLEQTAAYWLGEFPRMAERTRSNIVATFTTMADGFLRGQLYELFGTTTTLAPELTHHGVVLIIDLPVKLYHDLGRFAQVLWKYLWQRATEARDTGKNPRPVFLWADEAQNFVTSHDMHFQSTARSSRAATVYLTQNISNYHAVLGAEGGQAKAAADSLLGNLQTKIFHANGDSETNEWAERTFAKSWAWRTNTSSTTQPPDGKRGGQRSSVTAGASQSFDSEVPARAFTTLRKGGPANRFAVDAVAFQGGRTWAVNGKNHIRVSFDQRS